MTRMLERVGVGILLITAAPAAAAAQSFEVVGTRAAGMGGAFVAVADDASAAYWNPAGFAAGSLFSLVLDRTASRLKPSGTPDAGSESGGLVALGAPPLGLSYYRLRSTVLTTIPTLGGAANIATPGAVRLDTLKTSHTGVTLVQSIARGVAIGATIKVIRGSAASAIEIDGDHAALLNTAVDLPGRTSTKVDADVGVMASASRIKAGLTLRNISEPAFRTDGESPSLKLTRQARAGLALMPISGWIVAADMDLTSTARPLGQVRDFAAGAEGKVARKAYVRGGVRVNTAGDRAPALSAGASYAATASLLIDAQVTGGSERTSRGWGVAARFGY